MASTNKTTNYELSQFIGSDKPTWLSDYNGDMNKIDTQMKANADAATTAGAGVSVNTAAIGTLTDLTTTNKTNLVGAVNEVKSTADNASTVASNAYTLGSGADTKVTNLTNYLSLSQITTPTVTRTAGSGVTINSSTVKTAVNTNGSLGRIYGVIELTFTGGGSNTISIGDTNFRPSESFNVNGFAIAYAKGSNEIYYSSVTDKTLTFSTNGTVTFNVSGTAGDKATIIFQTGLIFATDFGD